jgi:hypothetical protein
VKLVTEFTPEFSWRKPLLIGPVPRGKGSEVHCSRRDLALPQAM